MDLGRGSAVLVLLVLAMLAAANVATATTYQVGGDGTWTIPSASNGINYQTWANGIKFKFGDELVFMYQNNSHNVLLVNYTSYQACDINTNDDIQGWDSGDDVIELNLNLTDYYFICGIPGHCTAGQKFHISVAAFAPAPVVNINITVPSSPTGSATTLQPIGVLILSLFVAFCTTCYGLDEQGLDLRDL